MSDVVFETERTIVRKWRASDLNSLLWVYGDKDAMRWVDDGEAITPVEAKEWLDVTRINYEKRGYGMFAVESKADRKVLGFCGIVHPSGQTEPEIKYAYARQHWGQGLATEIVKAIIEYGATQHGLTHIIATVSPANVASQRVLVKAGMIRSTLRVDDGDNLTQRYEWHRRVAGAD